MNVFWQFAVMMNNHGSLVPVYLLLLRLITRHNMCHPFEVKTMIEFNLNLLRRCQRKAQNAFLSRIDCGWLEICKKLNMMKPAQISYSSPFAPLRYYDHFNLNWK